MIKTVGTLVALAFATSVDAQETLEIDIFNPQNFIKSTTPANLLKGMLELSNGNALSLGDVTFGSCPTEVGDVFQIDFSQTYCQPNPVSKGAHVKFIPSGLVMKASKITNINVNAKWDGTPLDKEDHPMSQQIDANQVFSYNLGWKIPPFAPSGHYAIVIKIEGETEGATSAKTIGCITADFEL